MRPGAVIGLGRHRLDVDTDCRMGEAGFLARTIVVGLDVVFG